MAMVDGGSVVTHGGLRDPEGVTGEAVWMYCWKRGRNLLGWKTPRGFPSTLLLAHAPQVSHCLPLAETCSKSQQHKSFAQSFPLLSLPGFTSDHVRNVPFDELLHFVS